MTHVLEVLQSQMLGYLQDLQVREIILIQLNSLMLSVVSLMDGILRKMRMIAAELSSQLAVVGSSLMVVLCMLGVKEAIGLQVSAVLLTRAA